MAENLKKVPKRGILKVSTSFERRESTSSCSSHVVPKNPRFDEVNILETLHPQDKDYGFMKIEEPKTPYEYAYDDDEDEEDSLDHGSELQRQPDEELDPIVLAERIAQEGDKGPRPRRRVSECSINEDDLSHLTPVEQERRKSFEQKRKAHYNEFQAVKLARQLMASETDDSGGSTAAAAGAAGGASEAPDNNSELMDTTTMTSS